MGIRPEIMEREPLKNVEVEYERLSGPRKVRRPGFNRARLLDITQDALDIAAREMFPARQKLQLTMHIKGVRDFLNIEGEVQKSTRITILKQPAFSILIEMQQLSDDQVKKLSWAREQLVPRSQRQAPVRRAEKDPSEKPAAQPAAARAVERPTPAPAAVVARPESVQRPVTLIELIDRLEKFTVTDDLIMAVIEAAEASMDVEVLYPVQSVGESAAQEEEEVEAPEQALPAEGQAKPMNVYRLARNTRLHFSEAGTPVGPPAGLFYLSRLKSPENCFAVELGLDTMTQPGSPSFKQGSILIFTTKERVADGHFAFIKLRTGDEFVQVFFGKNDEVRIRMLNPKYPERVLRRSEVKMLCRLVGHYEDLA